MSKRYATDDFFAPRSKQLKVDPLQPARLQSHLTYPCPLPEKLPYEIQLEEKHKKIDHLPDLSIVHYAPLLNASDAQTLFAFLRSNFFWYRVTYEARGITIKTPRYTTVFGLDETHYFSGTDQRGVVLEKTTNLPPRKPLSHRPRPMPGCLLQLKTAIERATGRDFNFCLLNYYKDGDDSISYHSDDEFFLGDLPTNVSISLGAERDFLMRNKKDHKITWRTTLHSGDCVVMQGLTQSCWDHAVPKRKGLKGDRAGRINITFRKAKIRAGTENYYRYNVNNGPHYLWNPSLRQMEPGASIDNEDSNRSNDLKV